MLVLTLQGNRISGLTRFDDIVILPALGLPAVLREVDAVRAICRSAQGTSPAS